MHENDSVVMGQHVYIPSSDDLSFFQTSQADLGFRQDAEGFGGGQLSAHSG